MKINPNVLAATILGASIIVAVIIYANAPQAGRYVYKDKQTDFSLETSIFDSATGTRYSEYILNNIHTWSVTTPRNYERYAKEPPRPASSK